MVPSTEHVEEQRRPDFPMGGVPTKATPSSELLALQQTAGNQAVASLLERTDDPVSAVSEVLSSGRGRPLDEGVRADLGVQLGHDFSDVRVHTDSPAARSAQLLSAEAYTVGSDIVFNSDRYNPNSDAGRRTLAHELTHVVQQRQGPVEGQAGDRQRTPGQRPGRSLRATGGGGGVANRRSSDRRRGSGVGRTSGRGDRLPLTDRTCWRLDRRR